MALALIKSFEADPPTRYRVEYWLRMIATILYKAYGGKGDIPLPPWVKQNVQHEGGDPKAFAEYLSRIK